MRITYDTLSRQVLGVLPTSSRKSFFYNQSKLQLGNIKFLRNTQDIYSFIRPSIVEFTGDKDLDLAPKYCQKQERAFCSKTTIYGLIAILAHRNQSELNPKKTWAPCLTPQD